MDAQGAMDHARGAIAYARAEYGRLDDPTTYILGALDALADAIDAIRAYDTMPCTTCGMYACDEYGHTRNMPYGHNER